jgi:hypothetical protein
MGIIIGLAVAAFFVGTVNNQQWTILRILFVSLLLGVQSEAVWSALCDLVLSIGDEIVRIGGKFPLRANSKLVSRRTPWRSPTTKEPVLRLGRSVPV